MGNKFSRSSGKDQSAPHHQAPSTTRTQPSAAGHDSPTMQTPIIKNVPLEVDWRGIDPSRVVLSSDVARETIRRALPPTQQRKWTLLYASNQHGKNFTRLFRQSQNRGPTLIVIHEGPTDEGAPGRILGGYNNTEWRSVAEREHDAKAALASRHREERLSPGSRRPREFALKPKNQAKQFFGSEECFVFGFEPTAAENLRIYKSRPYNATANANYMYLFDTHPQGDKIGMGMGSDTLEGPGEFAWFLDRYLSKGRCSCHMCPTFGNTRLSAATEFSVAAVEVYAVDADALEQHEADLAAAGETEDGRSLGERHAVEKALMELHGTTFHSDRQRDEC